MYEITIKLQLITINISKSSYVSFNLIFSLEIAQFYLPKTNLCLFEFKTLLDNRCINYFLLAKSG